MRKGPGSVAETYLGSIRYIFLGERREAFHSRGHFAFSLFHGKVNLDQLIEALADDVVDFFGDPGFFPTTCGETRLHYLV